MDKVEAALKNYFEGGETEDLYLAVFVAIQELHKEEHGLLCQILMGFLRL